MRLLYPGNENIVGKVSIHASVKDATDPLAKLVKYIIVSIHASVKDATVGVPMIGPTTSVSIHASVKDATQSKCI